MALVTASYIGPVIPVYLLYPGSENTVLKTAATGTIVWADGSTQVVGADLTILTGTGAARFDNRQFVWVVVAVQGGDLRLYKEIDLPPSVGTYAYLWRITNRPEWFQQV